MTMKFNIGDSVRVLPPFAESFPSSYTVLDAYITEDGREQYTLEGCEGDFVAEYLEAA